MLTGAPSRHHATSSSSGYYQASQALGTLDWSKLRSGHRDGASAFSNNIRPKSLNIKLDVSMRQKQRVDDEMKPLMIHVLISSYCCGSCPIR